ncbi:mannosyl-glycoprotein endo-beta-N-acetylglucosamidase domain protein possible enterotoxin [Eggerthella sp. CAG:1427]|nr:mannosyl-glycoprotein endo-beta-N-acetylglucosamidase domain protein possible enterotoxin [Eggerthella sp. CAG:1427]
MKRLKLATGVLTATLLTAALPVAAFAMPGDIEEAVTQDNYNAYAHQSGHAEYDESELIAVDGKYVATANAMIRKAPFGEILGSVKPGKTYQVIGECPDCMWYKISGDVSGYVYASYLVPEGEYHKEANDNSNIRTLDMMMTVDVKSALNLREKPSTKSKVVTSVKPGTEIHVKGNVLNTDWYQCEYEGKIVYAHDNYLKPEFPQTMACSVSALNIRESANGKAKIIGTLHKGDKVKVSADENSWLRFEMSNGKVAYVYDEYMEAVGQ